MGTFVADAAKDAAANHIKNNADRQVMCQGRPASYAEATSDLGAGGKALGETAVAAGDFTLADGAIDGRKLTVGQKTGVTVDVQGIWDHTALVDTVTMEMLSVAPLQVDEEGTAQAGAASAITLRAAASAADDAYNGQTIEIVEGPGAGEVGQITDYDGTTKVAMVSSPWVTQPDATSKYEIYGLQVQVAQVMTMNAYDITFRDSQVAA